MMFFYMAIASKIWLGFISSVELYSKYLVKIFYGISIRQSYRANHVQLPWSLCGLYMLGVGL